jgi:hypothetical protein
MDENRKPQGQSNQISSNARGQQQSKKSWDGNERRTGTPDRRQSAAQPRNRNTADDVRLMNEGSSR